NDDFEVDIEVDVAESDDPIIAGSGPDNLTYTTTVTNNGPGFASNVVVDGTINWPAGVTPSPCVPVVRGPGAEIEITRAPDGSGNYQVLGQLPSGTSVALDCPVTVGPSAPAGVNTITASASLTSVDQPDTDDSNDSDSESTSIEREVDFSIDVMESDDPVVAGSGAGNLTHTVRITNNGPSDASYAEIDHVVTYPAGVTLDSVMDVPVPRAPGETGVSSRVPEGCPGTECYVTSGPWSAGQIHDVVFTFTAHPSAAVGTDVITTYSELDVSSVSETETNDGNDSDSESTSISREIDIVVSKADTPDPVVAGLELSGLQYVVTVENLGPSDADAVVINDPQAQFPGGVVVESATPSDGSYDGTDWTVDLPFGSGPETLTFILTVGPDAPLGPAAISNTAAFTGSGGGETPINQIDDIANANTEVIPTTATWFVSKDFLDDNGSSVTMTLSCEETATMGHNTDAVEPAPAMVSEGNSPQELTVTGFLQGPFGTTECEVTESNLPPEYFQVGTEGDCDSGDVDHEDTYDCLFINAPIRATFTVTKDFNDGNDAGVEIFIECTTGLPIVNDATVYEDHPIFDEIEFIVQDYDPYELDCTIYENVPVGYSESYDAGYDEVTSVFNITPDSDDDGCHFLEVASGDFTCHITNTLEEVDVVVDKIWIDDQA
ncbi:MAG: hypothetical protein R3330_08505, partial [Saprospiraceae bacterium]|nr:hypothetical protein [Saprospiraceae bacterium]